MLQDVGSHQCGIGEQACIDIIGLLTCLFLKGRHATQFTDVGVHVEIKIQLDGLGHIALDVDGGLFGVDAAGEVFGQDGASRTLYILRRGVRGQRVPVGDEEIAVVVFLHLHEATHGAVVVAEVKVSGGADAAQYDVFHQLSVISCSVVSYLGAKIGIYGDLLRKEI